MDFFYSNNKSCTKEIRVDFFKECLVKLFLYKCGVEGVYVYMYVNYKIFY